ncbi:MAG: nucleotidyltransferase domain-containing protein, partial [Proteobacteria bacterium]|nr:nucleotidyltransferase domain-containing protein [Pseudomonadota bacterium]
RRHTAQHLYRVVEGVTVPFDVVVATPSDLQKHRDNPGLIYQQALQEGKMLYVA